MPGYRSKRGRYFFSVKDNQPTLKQDIADLWANLWAGLWEEGPPPQAEQVDCHGDRAEVRRLWASAELVGYSDWPHLAQVCRTERVVHQKGKTRRELAYAVTSLSPQQADPARLLELWRGHWGIENRVFWVRDVTMDEDRCQIRTGSAPQIMAGLRNLVISLFPLNQEPNIAAALRRCAAHVSLPLSLLGAPIQ